MDHISRLPFETLETILMFTVTPIPPSIKGIMQTGMPLLRWDQEHKSEENILPRIFLPRLVSTRFHAASWRSFAHVLGDTIFDLRSRDSLANLMTLSSNRNLAPWVRKLTIGFYGAPSELRIGRLDEKKVEQLGMGGQEELAKIREVEESWWPEILHFEGDDDEHVDMVSSSAADWFLDTVGRCLASFRNLEEVVYSFDARILPARYKPILQYLPQVSDFQLNLKATSRTQRRGHDGLDLLFQALASRNIELRRMEISMPRYVGLVAPTLPAEGLRRLFSHITDLTIRSCQLQDFDLSWKLLQYCGKSLERLSIVITNEDEKALVPDDSWSQIYMPHLMRQIKCLKVKAFRLQIGTDDSWARTDYKRWHQSDLDEMRGQRMQWLDDVANVVEIRPQGLRAWLHRYKAWNGTCCEWKDE